MESFYSAKFLTNIRSPSYECVRMFYLIPLWIWPPADHWFLLEGSTAQALFTVWKRFCSLDCSLDCSLAVPHCSLAVPHCSLDCSLAVYHCSLAVPHCSLDCSSLFPWLFPWWSSLFPWLFPWLFSPFLTATVSLNASLAGLPSRWFLTTGLVSLWST